MLSGLLCGRKHQFCLNFAQQMKIAVQGGFMKSGVGMRFAWSRSAQAVGRAA